VSKLSVISFGMIPRMMQMRKQWLGISI